MKNKSKTSIIYHIFVLIIFNCWVFTAVCGQVTCSTTFYSGGDVTAVAVDPQGNKWFGTFDGHVSKFDGTTWTAYDNMIKPHTFGNYQISGIAIDSQGNKWFTQENYGGVYKFDGTTWIHYNASVNSGLPNDAVTCVAIDLQGNKWFGHGNGAITKFDGTTWTVYNTLTTTAWNGRIVSIAIDKRGNKWIATRREKGLVKFDDTNWTIYAKRNGDVDAETHSIAIDTLGNVWLTHNSNVLTKFDGTTWKIFDPEPIHPGVNIGQQLFFVCIDNQGNKWCLRGNGIAKFDDTNWTFYNPPCNASISYFYSKIAIDKQGNKWINCTNGNVSRFVDNEWETKNLNSSLINDDFNCIVSDVQNNKWIGTKAGVSKLSNANFDENNGYKWTNYSLCDGLSGENVLDIKIDKYNNKWFATNTGVTKFDDTNWSTYQTDIQFTTVAIDSQNNKWFVAYGKGIYKFNDTTWTVYNETNSGLINNYCYSMAIDARGIAWFATGGLTKFDGRTWTTYTPQNSDLLTKVIDHLSVDKQGNVWFKCYSNAIGNYIVGKFDGQTWKYFDSNDNSSGQILNDIKIDQQGNQWFRSAEGVLKFNGSSWRNYSYISDGCIRALPTVDLQGDIWLNDLFFDGLRKYNKVSRTAVSSLTDNQKLVLYPNPVDQILTIETPSVSDAQIINIVGRTMQKITTQVGSTNVNVGDLPKGVYLFKYRNQVVKFVKL